MILSPKQMAILCILSVLLGSAAVWGLRAAGRMVATAGGAAVVEASHSPLRLIMILNKTTFKVKEPLNIHLILENIGNETLTLCFSDGIDFPVFVVYDEKGSKVFDLREDLFLIPSHQPFDLPPKQSNGVALTWYLELQPGTYQIVGIYNGGLGFMLGFTIKTEPITITIVS